MSKQSAVSLMVWGASLIWGGMAVGQTSSSRSTSPSRISAADRKFVLNAARGGMAEVQMGQLAVKNGPAMP